MKYFSLCIFLCLGLLGCSSSGYRAPVADLAVNSKTSYSSKSSARSVVKLNTYKVKAGDTLYAIAWKQDLDVKTLAKRNNIKPPYLIYKDQLLNLKEKKQPWQHTSFTATKKNSVTSQKTVKTPSTSCTVQKCIKNIKKDIVKKNSKAYSATSVNKPIAKKTNNAQSKKINSWRWPAKGKLTKTFSASQVGMKGISIANQRGTAVYATTSGEVVYAGSGLRGYGNLIIIKHNYDYLSAYAHNEKLLVGEHEKIKAGQKIALMGDSGTDNVQLHFEIRYRGKSVDPLRYLAK